jgi:hypothetical protein
VRVGIERVSGIMFRKSRIRVEGEGDRRQGEGKDPYGND